VARARRAVDARIDQWRQRELQHRDHTPAPRPAGCGGLSEEDTGGLPLLPSPPQADERIAAVNANTSNHWLDWARLMGGKVRLVTAVAIDQRSRFVRLMKVGIEDITDDMQDRYVVIS
jgi:hypothetical protein